MVVGGLPIPRDKHAEAIAEKALDMQKKMAQFNAGNHELLSIRIGINSGQVVAGVIGTKSLYTICGAIRSILPLAWNLKG